MAGELDATGLNAESVRREVVLDRPTRLADLVPSLFPERSANQVFLVRAHDDTRFRLVAPAQIGSPGDRVVVYNVDLRDRRQIELINLLNSDAALTEPVVVAINRPWPDELAIIERYVPASGGRAIEICCGAGRVTPALVREGNEVHGLDISARCIETCRDVAPSLTFTVGDAAALPFPDGWFDTVACFENSLGMMFTAQAAVVREALRVCKPGGHVIFALRTGPNDVHVWHNRWGFIGVAQTFQRPKVEAAVARLQRGCACVGEVVYEEGAPRPWGGTVFYLVLRRRGPWPHKTPETP